MFGYPLGLNAVSSSLVSPKFIHSGVSAGVSEPIKYALFVSVAVSVASLARYICDGIERRGCGFLTETTAVSVV